GKLVFNNGWGAIDCSIKDLSEGGAKIRIGGWLNLPKVLELHLDRGDRYLCGQVRFVNDLMCVRFLEVLEDHGSAQGEAAQRRSQESSPRIAAV
ncbi:MAG: PilZ domain-containing protein, partial [Alphaproteobacteria bacterium]|nr:PilZ domain-containing protein [Alphaproteobacteria bacterium]